MVFVTIVSDETIFVALVFVERQNGLRRNGLHRNSLRRYLLRRSFLRQYGLRPNYLRHYGLRQSGLRQNGLHRIGFVKLAFVENIFVKMAMATSGFYRILFGLRYCLIAVNLWDFRQITKRDSPQGWAMIDRPTL